MSAELPPAPPGVECIGPFGGDYYRFTVDGYRVPYIIGNLDPVSETTWHLCLDERFGLTCSHDELRRWLCFVADCMAVAAGYSCFGANSQPKNPFSTRLYGISFAEHEHGEEP